MIMYLTLKIPQEHMQLTLIIIASFLAVLQKKKNIDEMQKFYKATHPQHEAISSAMSDVVIGHQGLSSACLQCSPAVHFQPWWHHTTSSLHTNVSHTFVQLDFL